MCKCSGCDTEIDMGPLDRMLERIRQPCGSPNRHDYVFTQTESGYDGPNENLRGVIDRFDCRGCCTHHYKPATPWHRFLHWLSEMRD